MRRSNEGRPGRGRSDHRGEIVGTAPPDVQDVWAGTPEPSGGRFRPRNWRVATKLYAILLIPVLLALALGGLRVAGSYETSREADEAQRVAELVSAATVYAHAVIDERDVAARPLLEGETGGRVVAEARQVTDEAREAFWAAVDRAPLSESLDRRISAVREAEPLLEPMRAVAYGDTTSGVETEEGYVQLQHPLMTLANELNLGAGNVTSYGRTIYALSLSKSASSLQRAIGTHLLVAPGPSDEELQAQITAFRSYAYLENVALGEFTTAGTPEDGDLLDETMTNHARDAAAEDPDAPELADMVRLISSGATPEELAEQGVTQESWFRAATAEFDAYRAVEARLADDAVAEASDIATAARRDVLVNSAVVVASVLLAFLIAALMARSMSRNMQRLRGAAFEVAEQRLPAMVDQLSRTDPGTVDTRVPPIPISSRDEIGEVARAFDQVHQEAVRLASEQALLRGNVNAIFTNLSGRNQGLIERQLSLISELENHEADPEQLEHLFKLDHLATRMRRNGENLLVLAGEEPQHRWNQPVPLVDVIRAAASEVEAYERMDLAAMPECEIHAAVVNDLVHLLAELMENATAFSSPHTRVRVTATRLPDGRIMIEIHDKGIGLTQEDFARINARLADPPAVDAEVSRRMGLYVVGRLAERHGIRVQLRPSGEQTGTTSLVMLPEAITQGGGGVPQQPEEAYPAAPQDAEAPFGDLPDPDAHRASQRIAAQYGFDDSRYGSSGDTVELDRVGRSLLRDQRRAARESRAAGAEPQDTPSVPLTSPASPAPPAPPAPAVPGPAPESAAGPAPGPEPVADRTAFDIHPSYTDSLHGGPAPGPHGVGFTRPDPAAAEYQAPTSPGLPGRDQEWQQPEEDPAQRLREEPWARTPGEVRWDRGPRREQRAGGTTSSGLPRRVPRANLTEHTLPESPQGGAQISRAPEDVRGRLSSLRRGVEQGRDAGVRRGTRNDEPGSGPGHTYDQER